MLTTSPSPPKKEKEKKKNFLQLFQRTSTECAEIIVRKQELMQLSTIQRSTRFCMHLKKFQAIIISQTICNLKI